MNCCGSNGTSNSGFWVEHPDDTAAWSRLVKYNELLEQATRGEYETEA